MKTIGLREYKENINERLAENPSGSEYNELKQFEYSSSILGDVAYNYDVQIVTEGAPINAAAFVIRNNMRTLFMVEGTLYNSDATSDAAEHEKTHLDKGIPEYTTFSDALENNTPHLNIIMQNIGLIGIQHYNLMEGFNDGITIHDHGKKSNAVGYKNEVYITEKIRTLCIDTMNIDLYHLFGDKKEIEFKKTLKLLASKLLMEKEFAKIEQDPEINPSLLQKVQERYTQNPLIIKDEQDAQFMIQKMFEEEIQTQALQYTLAEFAN